MPLICLFTTDVIYTSFKIDFDVNIVAIIHSNCKGALYSVLFYIPSSQSLLL